MVLEAKRSKYMVSREGLLVTPYGKMAEACFWLSALLLLGNQHCHQGNCTLTTS